MEGTETVSPKYEKHMHTLLILFALTEPRKLYWSNSQKFCRILLLLCLLKTSLICEYSLNMSCQGFHRHMKDEGFIKLNQVIFSEWIIQDTYLVKKIVLTLCI